MEDFKKEVDNLRENLQNIEEERDKYLELSKKQAKDHKSSIEESSSRLNDRIRELEQLLEDKEQ